MSGRVVDGKAPKGVISGKDKVRNKSTYVGEFKVELREVLQKQLYFMKNNNLLGFCSLFLFDLDINGDNVERQMYKALE